MKTANVKNKTAKVKVKIFGQEIEQFGITSDDSTITTEVIANYINSGNGDDETREVADPYGFGLEVYNSCIEQIDRYLDILIKKEFGRD